MTNGRVFYFSEASSKSGFGQCARNISRGLGKAGFDTFLLGWGYRIDEVLNMDGYKIIPFGDHPPSQNSPATLAGIYNQFQPVDAIITQWDSRMGIDWWHLVKRPCSWINYPVIDGFVWDAENTQSKWASNWVEFMKGADKTVAMSEFGAKILKANGIDATPIPHGVDTGFFIPLNEEQKKQVRQGANIPEDAIVVGDVFKNMMRKLPDKFFQTLVLARKKNPKIVGLIHSTINMGEFNLPLFAKDYGLTSGKDIFFSQSDLDYGRMPMVYGAMDMFYHPGGIGEGFGLPVTEAMSCGIPVIAPKATTMPEILDNGNAGVLTSIVKYPKTNVPVSFSSFNLIEFVMPNIFDAAEEILRLANDKQLRQDIGFKGRVRASTIYDWSAVLPQWIKVVKDVISPELPAEWQSLLAVGDDKGDNKNE
jgi:glycosyltransferase involved in cell wall biosynthesis